MSFNFTDKEKIFIAYYKNLLYEDNENNISFQTILDMINDNNAPNIKMYYKNLMYNVVPSLFELGRINKIKEIIDEIFLSEHFISINDNNKDQLYIKLNKLINNYQNNINNYQNNINNINNNIDNLLSKECLNILEKINDKIEIKNNSGLDEKLCNLINMLSKIFQNKLYENKDNKKEKNQISEKLNYKPGMFEKPDRNKNNSQQKRQDNVFIENPINNTKIDNKKIQTEETLQEEIEKKANVINILRNCEDNDSMFEKHIENITQTHF